VLRVKPLRAAWQSAFLQWPVLKGGGSNLSSWQLGGHGHTPLHVKKQPPLLLCFLQTALANYNTLKQHMEARHPGVAVPPQSDFQK